MVAWPEAPATSGSAGRALDGRGRVIAAIVGLLLVLPVAVSAGRAIADDWEPSGDEAVIAVRVHDVLSTDPAHRSAVNVRPLRHGHPRGTLGRSNSTCWPSRSGCSARRSASAPVRSPRRRC